jgi:deazaflavin-dependent oxidoreductase (nitroreductase family)
LTDRPAATTIRGVTADDVAAYLAPVARRGTARITTRGRRTGKPHAVTIWFAVDHGSICLGTLDARRDWVKNVTKSPDVTLDIGEVRLRGHVRTVTEAADVRRIRDLLAAKYWAAWIASWFGMGPARTFRIDDVQVA